MSSKHLRRLLEEKKKEEEEAQVEDEEEHEKQVERKPKINRFAFMMDDDDDSEKEEEQEESEKEEEKVESVPQPKQTGNKKKKKNKKGKKLAAEVDDDMKLLDQLSLQNKASTTSGDYSGAGGIGESLNLEKIFKVDPRQFDPSAELKRAIGKAFKEGGSSTSNSHNQRKVAGRIVKQKHTWPPVRSIGLSMSIIPSTKPSETKKYFKFEHNVQYETLERLCWAAEDTMDLNLINEILQDNYYHLNSLLLMANMFRMQEDVTQAGDMIERGIFFCEQSFHSQFLFTDWNHRIEYKYYENRAFLLFLHRFMLNCIQKRCFETALNVAKFIFKLDADHDPLAIMLIIDTIAIKARQYQWLNSMYRTMNYKRLDLLPNMRYSLALAKFLSASTDEDMEEATRLLTTAIRQFPTVVTKLLDELQIQADPLVESNQYMSIFALNKEKEGLQEVIKIYVKQSAELWKVPETLVWLEQTTRLTVQHPESAKEMETAKEVRNKVFLGLPPNIKRLSILLGLMSSDHGVTDPEPPASGVYKYTREDTRMDLAAQQNVIASLLHSLIPAYSPNDTLADVVNRLWDRVRGPEAGQDDNNQQPPPPNPPPQ